MKFRTLVGLGMTAICSSLCSAAITMTVEGNGAGANTGTISWTGQLTLRDISPTDFNTTAVSLPNLGGGISSIRFSPGDNLNPQSVSVNVGNTNVNGFVNLTLSGGSGLAFSMNDTSNGGASINSGAISSFSTVGFGEAQIISGSVAYRDALDAGDTFVVSGSSGYTLGSGTNATNFAEGTFIDPDGYEGQNFSIIVSHTLVPEPTGFVLIGMFGAVAIFNRKRK